MTGLVTPAKLFFHRYRLARKNDPPVLHEVGIVEVGPRLPDLDT